MFYLRSILEVVLRYCENDLLKSSLVGYTICAKYLDLRLRCWQKAAHLNFSHVKKPIDSNGGLNFKLMFVVFSLKDAKF